MLKRTDDTVQTPAWNMVRDTASMPKRTDDSAQTPAQNHTIPSASKHECKVRMLLCPNRCAQTEGNPQTEDRTKGDPKTDSMTARRRRLLPKHAHPGVEPLGHGCNA